MSAFHIGVVEDRHDPLQMGRVRVRVLGIHSPDRVNEVPINSLPWSLVMFPANVSSSAGGISQLVEGTWVLVMYYDENFQDAIVIGALPETHSGEEKPDYAKGFSDPFGVYPKFSEGGSNTSLAGKPDKFQEHPTYTERSRTRITGIPIAKQYTNKTVAVEGDQDNYTRTTYDEPDLRGGMPSTYPYNNVKEYEGGMLEEYDSSPSGTRMTKMHPSGTYEEIVLDGSKTVKVVGDGYEIILGNKMMYVKGDMNLTVEGDMRTMVKGNYLLEVGGDHSTMVAGSRSAKLLGNDTFEVSNDISFNIKNNVSIKAGNNMITRVGNDNVISIGNDCSMDVTNDLSHLIGNNGNFSYGNDNGIIVLGNRKVISKGEHKLDSVGSIILDTDGNLSSIVTGNIEEDVAGSQTTSVSGNVKVTGAIIDLN